MKFYNEESDETIHKRIGEPLLGMRFDKVTFYPDDFVQLSKLNERQLVAVIQNISMKIIDSKYIRAHPGG